MLNLPKTCIIFDTEFTTWEGAMERGWSGENEYMEIVQIGSILVDTETLEEKDSQLIYIKPTKNPKVSDYFTTLTGIKQEDVDRYGVSFDEALKVFGKFIGDRDAYSFGGDENVIQDNCDLLEIPFPFDKKQFHNICDTFNKFGISTEGYMSSTISRAFGEEPKHNQHDGLGDARSILDGLRLLTQQKTS